MTKAEQYAKKYLDIEIQEIQNSNRNLELLKLTVYEKAVIYKYSEDGYENVNEHLRLSKGKKILEFGKILDSVLSKLESYKGLVYRCTTLSQLELNVYYEAYNLAKPITEYPFVSTSKSKALAYLYGRNTIFRIYSRTGKDIEKIAKFGSDHPQNEQEVLFKPGTSFNVIDISKEDSFTLIIMEERR